MDENKRETDGREMNGEGRKLNNVVEINDSYTHGENVLKDAFIEGLERNDTGVKQNSQIGVDEKEREIKSWC